MGRLSIDGVHKSFGKVEALKGIDLEIDDGEFCVFVGPSGCGKSTLLRSIAGLEDVDQGTISIDGTEVSGLRPRDRNVAMVFQNYALYPYLNVFENIAFGLRARKAPNEEVTRKVQEAAETLHISGLLDRYPRAVTITLLTRAVLCGTHDACRLACDSFARKLFRGLSARSLREARAGARLRASCALARTGATRGASRAFRRRGRSCRGWRRNWG